MHAQSTTPDVAIIVCTRNRAQHLAEMLPTLLAIDIPEGINIEAIVVDNGSSDETSAVISQQMEQCHWLRNVIELETGLSNARNAGVRATKAPIILFTDDDVRIPTDWVAGMLAGFADPKVHIVQGHIVLADSLILPWMEFAHKAGLAEFRGNEAQTIVGANFGFRREVWESVGGFDTRFGPGTPVGFGDDTLFGCLGRRRFGAIHVYRGAPVVHHPDISRMNRQGLLRRTEQSAMSELWLAAALGNPIPYQATRPVALNRIAFGVKALRARLFHKQSPLTQDELYGYYSFVMSREATKYAEACGMFQQANAT